jgi:hypothetical protein
MLGYAPADYTQTLAPLRQPQHRTKDAPCRHYILHVFRPNPMFTNENMPVAIATMQGGESSQNACVHTCVFVCVRVGVCVRACVWNEGCAEGLVD